MIKSHFSIWVQSVALLLVAGAAHAQATRTWVSGVGDDANPCSRTAPCKTFAGAISKTAAAGEISVLDPGGFGTVTVTKSLTIDGQGQLSSITNSGTSGITINAGVNDVVTIRNISINGVGATIGLNGIRYIQAGQVVVDSVAISGNSQSGIEVASTGAGRLVVTNTTISQSAFGVRLSSGAVNALLDRVSIRGNGIGVDAISGTVDIIHSVVAQNSTFGLYAEGGTIGLDDTMLSGNGTAVQAQTGSIIRISNSDLYNNQAGFGCGGGTIASAQNNRKGGNSGSGGAVCAPNATITMQ